MDEGGQVGIQQDLGEVVERWTPDPIREGDVEPCGAEPPRPVLGAVVEAEGEGVRRFRLEIRIAAPFEQGDLLADRIGDEGR
ncbi:hypothetical protein D3C87_1769960 [compost metagenome]